MLKHYSFFLQQHNLTQEEVLVQYFDAAAFDQHKTFYTSLPVKPNVVVYAAGYLKDNQHALINWEGSYQMMTANYCGAVSILNIIASDTENKGLQRIIGLSSLSGVRGRKSNFIYGSTKAAFTQYLAGLRQHLFSRNIIVNVIVAGYIRTKMNAGLNLEESLMLEAAFVARAVVKPVNRFYNCAWPEMENDLQNTDFVTGEAGGEVALIKLLVVKKLFEL